MTNNEEIFTIEEAAAYLKVSVNSLYKLAQDKKLPCRKVGKHWRFSKIAIDAWITNGGDDSE